MGLMNAHHGDVKRIRNRQERHAGKQGLPSGVIVINSTPVVDTMAVEDEAVFDPRRKRTLEGTNPDTTESYETVKSLDDELEELTADVDEEQQTHFVRILPEDVYGDVVQQHAVDPLPASH